MPRYLFLSLLLLLLMSCALCSATSTNPGVELFKEGRIKALNSNGVGHEEVDVDWLEFPSLVLVDGVMVGQVCASVDDYEGYLLTKYIGTKEDGWAKIAIDDGGENWQAQLAVKGQVAYPAASVLVAKGNTIYALHVSNAGASSSKNEWKFLLSIGEVKHDDKGTISIVWRNEPVKESSTKDIQTKLENVDLIHKSGFVMEDETFVFVFTGVRKNSKIFMMAYSKDPSTDLTFHFDDKTLPNCLFNCFTWEKKLLMFPLYCHGDASNYKLRESDDMGKRWDESSGKLAENLKGRSLTDTYTPITIGERHLLLFTEAEAQERKDLYAVNLFVAYNDHIQSLGNIFTVFGSFTSGSLLYTKDELFYLGAPEKYSQNIMFFRLKNQLEKMKKLLDDWDAEDKQRKMLVTPPEGGDGSGNKGETVTPPEGGDGSGNKEETVTLPEGGGSNTTEAGTPQVNGSEHARNIVEESSVHLHINVAVVLLCVLFGTWAPFIL